MRPLIHLRRAFQIDPNNAGLCTIALDGQRENRANLMRPVAHYSRAIEINPEFSEAFISLGLALTAQAKFDAALIRYRRAIEIEPKERNGSLANLGLANFAIAQGKIEEGIRPIPDAPSKSTRINVKLYMPTSAQALVVAGEQFEEAHESWIRSKQRIRSL